MGLRKLVAYADFLEVAKQRVEVGNNNRKCS